MNSVTTVVADAGAACSDPAATSHSVIRTRRLRNGSQLVQQPSWSVEQRRLMTQYLCRLYEIRQLYLARVTVAPFTLEEQDGADRFVRHTHAAVEALGRGDFSLLTSSLTANTEFRVFGSLARCPGFDRLRQPFYGQEGQMEAYMLLMDVFTWLDFTAEMMPVVSESPSEVKVLITGRCSVRMHRDDRVISWNYARFWVWDSNTSLLRRQQYHEMDQAVADALLDHIHDSHDNGLAADATSELSSLKLIDPTHQSPLFRNTFPALSLEEVDVASASQDPTNQTAILSPLSPSPLLSSHPYPYTTPLSPWNLSSATLDQDGISEHSSASVLFAERGAVPTPSACKLHGLLPGCAGTVTGESGRPRSGRGPRTMCASCRSACVFDTASGGQTVYKRFVIDHCRVLFVCVQASDPSASPSNVGITQRKKRRFHNSGATRLTDEAKRSERLPISEVKLDDQGRLMNRDRSITIPAASSDRDPQTLTAKRLTVHVSSSQELYVYIFESARDTTTVSHHWSSRATGLMRAWLTCQGFLSDLRLKYHYTGEEIQIEPEQLIMLLANDPQLLTARLHCSMPAMALSSVVSHTAAHAPNSPS